MIALRSDLARPQKLDEDARPSTIEAVAKFSVSLPDGLVRDIKKVAHGDVGAFIVAVVRDELDRRRLHALALEREEELGPPDEAEMAKIGAMFAEIEAANAEARKDDDR
jgi:hypothetical protein